MAILKFRVYFEEDDSVYRDVVIRPQQTFFDLHEAILRAYDFDNKHGATFYRSNDYWQGRFQDGCETAAVRQTGWPEAFVEDHR